MALVYVEEDGLGDYTSLAAAITANELDIEIIGEWDNDEDAHIVLNDANRTVEATGDAKFPGYTSATPTHWRIRPTTSGHTFELIATGCAFTGMEIKRVGSAGATSDECFRVNHGMDFEDCLFWMDDGLTTEDQSDGFYINDDDGKTFNFTNCMFMNFGRAGFNDSRSDITLNINSCVFYNCGGYYSTYGGCTVFNNTQTTSLSMFNTLLHCRNETNTDCIMEVSSPTVTYNLDYSIDSDGSIATFDGSAVGSLGSHNYTDDNTKSSDGDWVIFEDITSAPYDLRLQSNTYNEAQDMHSSSSGAGLSMPSTDIVGTTRAAAYECGAFTIVAAGGVTSIHHILNQ